MRIKSPVFWWQVKILKGLKTIKLAQRSGEKRQLIMFKGKSIWTLHFALLDLYLLVYHHFIPVSVKNLLQFCPFIRIITNDSLCLTTFKSLTCLNVQSRAAVLAPHLHRAFLTGSLWRTWRASKGHSLLFLHHSSSMWPKSRQDTSALQPSVTLESKIFAGSRSARTALVQ